VATVKNAQDIEQVVQQIDRLIAEMSLLREQIAALSQPAAQAERSVRDAEYFGMWADRDDMAGRSSREWLDQLRAEQWKTP
jgi:hypothetical protein